MSVFLRDSETTGLFFLFFSQNRLVFLIIGFLFSIMRVLKLKTGFRMGVKSYILYGNPRKGHARGTKKKISGNLKNM